MTNPQSFTDQFDFTKKHLLIIDEIHKSKQWKNQLKSLWDQNKAHHLDLIVTGSAQLNTLKKAGDSLLGRYYNFNLHPFTVGEILEKPILPPENIYQVIKNNSFEKAPKNFTQIYENLKKFSGFPEPYTRQNERKLNLWRKTRIERLIREDLRDLSKLPDLSSVEVLASLLPEKIGSGLSIENLRMTLETSHHSVKRWLKHLESVYFHFSIGPYSKSINNAIRKEHKIYLYDYTELQDPGILFENIIACHLLKACHYWTDLGYGHFGLHYARNKQKTEIDFVITKNNRPWLAVETKVTSQKVTEPVVNLLNQLKCPLVLLSEKSVEPTRSETPTGAVTYIGVDRFLQLLP